MVRTRTGIGLRLDGGGDPTPRNLQGLRRPRHLRRGDRRGRRRSRGPRLRARARRPGGQAGAGPANRARARHARERRGADAALPRRHGERGSPRGGRRDDRHRDALFPRRLARSRRRADVHRLAQPQGLHRRQAGGARGDRAVGRPWHPGRPAHDRGGARRRAGRRLGGGGRHLRGVPGRRPALHRPRRGQAAARGGRRQPGDGRPDDRAGARGPGPRARRAALDPGPRFRRGGTQPAARGEPAHDRRSGSLRGRGPGDRLGRRRRPLLLHRRRRQIRARRLCHRAARRLHPAQAAGRDDPLRRAGVARRGRHRGGPRRHRADQSRRPCLLQDPDARRGRRVRRRGLGPLLLPRLLQRRLGGASPPC